MARTRFLGLVCKYFERKKRFWVKKPRAKMRLNLKLKG